MTLNKYIEGLKDKNIAVVGVGVSNVPLLHLLADNGCCVTACDRRSAEEIGAAYDGLAAKGVLFSLGEHYIDTLDFDVVFRTPGIHPDQLKAAVRTDTVITSEMEAFFACCPCKIIAVTGSDGKTTTSTIISELLGRSGYVVHLGGNIGKPLLCEIPSFGKDDIAVLELSSFQLHSMYCKPDIAVITNLSPNHLDVHPTFEDYVSAKQNIYKQQDEECRLVLNLDNALTATCAKDSAAKLEWFSMLQKLENGFCFHDNAIWRGEEKYIDADDILLPGMHNVENYMAAFAATDGLVTKECCVAVAKTFGGVAHRIELIRKYKDIRFYNDSIATSPTRTIAGLHSFKEKLILIAGGHDKGIPFDELAKEILACAKALFLVGETAEKIFAAVTSQPDYDPEILPVYIFEDFNATISAAASFAQKGDCVLFSPACSSFDMFRNFVERGNTFRKIVEELE